MISCCRKIYVRLNYTGGGVAFSLEAIVSNVGNGDIREVVQVYIKALDSGDAAPNGKLCGFAGAAVKAGEKVSGGSRFAVSVGFGQPGARTEELTGKKTVGFAAVR